MRSLATYPWTSEITYAHPEMSWPARSLPHLVFFVAVVYVYRNEAVQITCLNPGNFLSWIFIGKLRVLLFRVVELMRGGYYAAKKKKIIILLLKKRVSRQGAEVGKPKWGKCNWSKYFKEICTVMLKPKWEGRHSRSKYDIEGLNWGVLLWRLLKKSLLKVDPVMKFCRLKQVRPIGK